MNRYQNINVEERRAVEMNERGERKGKRKCRFEVMFVMYVLLYRQIGYQRCEGIRHIRDFRNDGDTGEI